MLIGASIGAEDLEFYKPLIPGNDLMRIFPDKVTVNGKADVGVLPAWTDPRFIYCRDRDVIPFLSTKVDGYAAGLTYVRTQLINMPQWLKDRDVALYITDRHEPEGDLAGGAEPASANAFKANFKAFVDMLNTLPTELRNKIKVGPILTKTWTEKAGTTRDYDLYDPMSLGAPYGGDFLGVDMYHETGTSSTVVTPGTIIPAATFVAKFKAYKFSVGDTRPRLWPELGLIGMPGDTTGSARAAWIQDLYDEVDLMRAGQPGWTQPWDFEGFVWWQQQGKATGVVAQVGQRRDFPLDDRTTSSTTFVKLNPPLPLNKFNELWAAEHAVDPPPAPGPGPDLDPDPDTQTHVWDYWVGATMKSSEITTYESRIPANGLFRIFSGSSSKLPPAWDDPRFSYVRRSGAVPFCSSKISGDSSQFAAMRTWIINMPQWLKDRPGVVLYLTDHHEPENDYKQVPSTYLTNYTNWYNAVIATLPSEVRAKVAAGPVVTLQWIVNPSNGNGNYQQYDPGPSISDFYGIDMYMNSWKPGGGSNSTMVAEAYVNPVTFLAGVKGYRYNNTTDTRPRIFPEMGAIGIPTDSTGSARAAWLEGICAELDTWTAGAQGWEFMGFSWWNNQGTTSTTSLTPIGTSRYFYLDKYQSSSGALTAYADPLPLESFNEIAAAHHTLVTGGGGTGTAGQGLAALSARSGLNARFVGAPAQQVPPPVVVPPTTRIPATGPSASRALQAIYTVLVTDPFLNILGDPLVKWQSLQATLRWKEPGSGQIVIPADSYVRSQLVPGCRIVVLRRVLGTQHVLIAGPMEQVLWERSDGADDNAGVGKMTVTFVDDMAWLGARLTYPNPRLTPDAQTTDYWEYSGNPEQAMLKLVEEQAGPLALAGRQVPKLFVAPHSSLSDATVQIEGTSDVAPREKFERVTDVLRKICTLGANSGIPGAPVYHPDSLGFRVRQTTMAGDPIILFEPMRARDLTGEAHFSFGKGNLKYFSYEIAAPKANTLIIGGSGDGSDAYVREVVAEEPGVLDWGRFEAYKAEPGSDIQDDLKLADSAKQGFAEQLPSSRLASNAADTPDQRYGVHYNVGDVVSVELAPGQFESAPVQTVNLQAFPTAGEVVGITIGDQSSRYDSPFIERFRELDRRLGRIERRGERA